MPKQPLLRAPAPGSLEKSPPSSLPSSEKVLRCDCFGVIHKKMERNCLRCGRISCSMERGLVSCSFCGQLWDNQGADSEGDVIKGVSKQAFERKDKLLEYDRQVGKTTKIHDDQADYFASSSSVWLGQEERTEAKERDEGERKRVKGRGGGMLDLGKVL